MDTSNSKKRMLEALEKNKGIVTYAAKQADISRSTHYLWMQEDAEYKKAVEDIDNVALDFVEEKLFQRIEGVLIDKGDDVPVYEAPPDTTAIIFYLKTKGRKRGYNQDEAPPASRKLSIEIATEEEDERTED